MTWQHNVRRWRWECCDEGGRVVYWISDQAVGTEFDSQAGFAGVSGERVPPLPPEAYTLEHQHPAGPYA